MTTMTINPTTAAEMGRLFHEGLSRSAIRDLYRVNFDNVRAHLESEHNPYPIEKSGDLRDWHAKIDELAQSLPYSEAVNRVLLEWTRMDVVTTPMGPDSKPFCRMDGRVVR